MSEDQKRLLETKLWNIADTLRGKMDADDFKDYILGFIFYKYLSRKMELHANKILKPDGMTRSTDTKEKGSPLKKSCLPKLNWMPSIPSATF